MPKEGMNPGACTEPRVQDGHDACAGGRTPNSPSRGVGTEVLCSGLRLEMASGRKDKPQKDLPVSSPCMPTPDRRMPGPFRRDTR